MDAGLGLKSGENMETGWLVVVVKTWLVRLLVRVVRSFDPQNLANDIPYGERSEKPTVDRGGRSIAHIEIL